MRIRILTAMPGFPAGAVTEVHDAKAKVWLGMGNAEETKDKVTLQGPGTEKATADPSA